MNPNTSTWLKRNGPLLVLAVSALLALLYLGDDIVKQRGSRVSFNPILPTISSQDPYQGSQDAEVKIIEFGSFTCSACKLQVADLKELINNFGDQVQVVWKDAPLDPIDTTAYTASIAAHCAAKQNKFWEMHDKLFEKQSELNADIYATLAEEIGINVEDFTSCVTERQTSDIVEDNLTAARDAQLTALPTLFINGVEVEGYQSYDDLLAALAGL